MRVTMLTTVREALNLEKSQNDTFEHFFLSYIMDTQDKLIAKEFSRLDSLNSLKYLSMISKEINKLNEGMVER